MTDNNKPENTRGTTPHTRDDATTTDTPQPSLASRVQSSAAGLARAFQGSTDAAQTLASATEGKAAGPSRAGAGAGAAQGHISGSFAPRASGARAPATSSFRSSDNASESTIPALNEEDFQFQFQHPLDTDTDTSPRTYEIQNETGSWKGKQRAQDPVQHYNTAWDRAQQPHPKTQYTPSANDGSEVVTLLSDPSFDPNTDPYTEPDLEIAEPAPLTPAEIEALESFRKAVGSESVPREQGQKLSGSSLVPDIDAFLADSGGMSDLSVRDSVLQYLPGASDWVGVQERYHDEVWGYLRPALEAAKVEMEEGNGQEGGVEGPAVRRLRMILKHMG